MAVDALLHPSLDEEPVPTHAEEQAALRAETISAFRSAATADGEEDLLMLRNPADDMDSTAYRQFLLETVGEDDMKVALSTESLDGVAEGSVSASRNASEGKAVRRKKKANANAAVDEDFLLNYILNRGWVDQSQRRNPTLDEVTAMPEPKSRPGPEPSGDAGLAEDDSDFEDITDRFESSYNFRFEEPNAAVIATHPRNLPSTVRRQDDHRKQQRENRRARKEEESLAKQEELKRLKNLKRKELEEKLKMLGHVSGKDEIRSDQLDLEGDFDPEGHDSQMRGIFDDEEYYGQAEASKPMWDDDIDVSDIVPEAADQSRKRPRARKADANAAEVWDDVDAPYASTNMDAQREVDEYMDEYFGLDYNGMVGDMPTRFKYMKVPATAYGLTPTEILLADDAELNTYMGMKKYAPYRPDLTDKRGKRYWELKEALKGRAWTGEAVEDAMQKTLKKRKGKKERAKLKAQQDDEGPPPPDEEVEQERPRKRQKATQGR